MRLNKYKQLRRKLARRHIRSRELTDTKPLQRGGRLHVHEGRVHRGAGFEGRQPNAGEQIRDVVSMTGIGSVLRVITDAITPEDKRKVLVMSKEEQGEHWKKQKLKKQHGVLTKKQEKYLLLHPDDSKYYKLAIKQVKARIAKKRGKRI